MPRRPRIHLPGVPQHVIQRGVDRQPVFFCDADCLFFLALLGEYAAKRSVLLHSYCLMTNHFHLLVSSPTGEALSGLMQDIGRRYVQYINQTYQRTGGLWQGRYRRSYVQSEVYLLACMRYVELNPVRAGMVQAPGDYRWSSYRTNAFGDENLLISQHEEYLALGNTSEERSQAYRALFATELDDAAWSLIRTATQQGVVAGESRFAEQIGQRLGKRLQPRPQGRPHKETTI